MKKAEASIYLDKNRPKKNGKCSVKIKITYNRKRKYFSTWIDLTPIDFEQTFFGKRKTKIQKENKGKIEYFEKKANDVIKKLNVFTFDLFKEHYFDNRDVINSVSFAFDKQIERLKKNDQIGTATTYECAKNSIIKFKKDLVFADVTVDFLNDYEKQMRKEGKSVTTISMYLRSLRSVFNNQNIDKSIYPFGKVKDRKYKIPTASNTKRALTLEEVAKIYNYESEPNSMEDLAKDYWLFMYLCNGMNVKDVCLLKWANINGNTLNYVREKTKNTDKKETKIRVSLKHESFAIIKKWGQPSINKDTFIFPHLNNKMTAERQRRVYQQVTKNINKYMKRIAKKVGIDKEVTTYYARHSFATILQRSGANISMISDLLGHSNLSVTQNYLSGFESEQIEKTTDVLIAFNKSS